MRNGEVILPHGNCAKTAASLDRFLVDQLVSAVLRNALAFTAGMRLFGSWGQALNRQLYGWISMSVPQSAHSPTPSIIVQL